MKKTKRIVKALCTNNEGDMLMGFRADRRSWSHPGGHLYEKEDIYLGMIREFYEEVGVLPVDLKLIKAKFHKDKNILIYIFRVKVEDQCVFSNENDPDKEFEKIDFKDPNEVLDDLDVPAKDNVVIHCWLDEDESGIFKNDIPGGLADKKKPSDFSKEKLKEGKTVELEHTSDPKIAEEIAMDHLTEDLDYYKKLKTIEKE